MERAHPPELVDLTPPPALAIAAKGFRPFFLLAAAFAVLVIPSWLLVVRGDVVLGGYVDGVSWHVHEMVFGFFGAVIAGFLLTAVSNWTQRQTLVGAPLMALAGLWVCGRVAMAVASRLPFGVAAAIDLAFLPCLLVALARPIIAAKNHRNLVILAILGALFAANACVHLDALGVLPRGVGFRAGMVTVDLLLLLILIIAGRVFPMFTRNTTGLATIRSSPKLELAVAASMAGLLLLDVLLPNTAPTAAASGVVAVLAALRARHWGTRSTVREPLLWVLHGGYLWLVLGLGARAASHVAGGITAALAFHALTIGACATIALGMMARVALGHTGRPLIAPPRVAWSFAAMIGAAFARAVGPLLLPAHYFVTIVVAGSLWTIAFTLFLIAYAPILLAPRVDGKPG